MTAPDAARPAGRVEPVAFVIVCAWVAGLIVFGLWVLLGSDLPWWWALCCWACATAYLVRREWRQRP